jgi:hypothetical protein
MNFFRRTTTDPDKDQEPEDDMEVTEGKIREFMRREGAPPRITDGAPRQNGQGGQNGQNGQPDGDVVAHNLGFLLQRVSLSSVQEIDRLIDDLKVLSAQLQHESARIQREIGEYATLSQAAMQSTKIIADSLTQWRVPDDASAVSE